MMRKFHKHCSQAEQKRNIASIIKIKEWDWRDFDYNGNKNFK